MNDRAPGAGPPRAILLRNVAIVLAVAALATLGWFLLGRRGASEKAAPAEPARIEAGAPAEPAPSPGGPPPAAAPSGSLARSWTDALGSEPRWPDDLSAPASCPEVAAFLDQVCRALDRRRAAPAGEVACAAVVEVAGRLAAAPPRVSGELRDPAAMVANVAHLFRVLGRERLGQIRRWLREQPDLAEPAALALYRWAISREQCAEGDAALAPVRLERLYDYAAFLFQTLGGQAYLRRREPRVEALACFYALEILDQAIARDYNPQGVDPRPEIDRCSRLIRAQPLVFADRYLQRLEELSARWERVGGSR